MLILTETTVPSSVPNGSAVVLDIDVFKEADMISDDVVWELLEMLRARKNQFFEGCITQKTRDLFGERRGRPICLML